MEDNLKGQACEHPVEHFHKRHLQKNYKWVKIVQDSFCYTIVVKIVKEALGKFQSFVHFF